MEIDTEALREDLVQYHKLAAGIGLPKGTDCPEKLCGADEAVLVDTAATLGWDLGKYVVHISG